MTTSVLGLLRMFSKEQYMKTYDFELFIGFKFQSLCIYIFLKGERACVIGKSFQFQSPCGGEGDTGRATEVGREMWGEVEREGYRWGAREVGKESVCYWKILSVSITLYIYLCAGGGGKHRWGEGERGGEREGESVCYWQILSVSVVILHGLLLALFR